jgi:membrane-associated protein
VLPDLETLSALALYGFVGALVFVESGLLVGFFLPGDTVLFAAGLYAADPRSGASVAVLAAVVLVAAVTGDAVGYWFGRRTGPALLRREGRVLNSANLERAQRFYDRYGVFAIVAARWIPWVRVFAPVLAGVAGMPYCRFLAANVVGALSWGVGLVVLGYYAASVPGLKSSAIAVGITVTVLSLVAAGVRAYRERSGRRR